jgi:SNF2 family DNA or RNA helicase
LAIDPAVYEKLKAVRQKDDFTLPQPPNLRLTLKAKDGTETPLTLRGYQKQMVVHLLAMKRFVVGDDTGLGKTLESISALCYIWMKDPNRKVVVLTKKSSIYQWESEFKRFTDGVTVYVADGDPVQRTKAHVAWENATGPTVLVQGYVSAGNDFNRLQKWKDYILITDEATVFKSHDTRTHKVCRHLADMADRVWALTATLIKNTLVEGYGIYRVVVPELFKLTPSGFEKNFCIIKMQQIHGGRQVPVVVGYRDEDIRKFRDMIDPYYLGRPKHAVAAELPVLVTREAYVGMTAFQQTKYNEALEGLLGMGTGDEKATDQLTAIIYCQEIVNHPALIGFKDKESEKLDVLVNMVTEGGDLEDKKVIVFTRFKTMVDTAIPVLKKAGIKSTRVTGDEDAQARKDAMEAFQDPNSDTKIIWITMAGGDAINLQAAEAIVFYDTPWSAGDYLQILGRMIRIGSVHDRVYAIHLICTDTIDERVQDVRRKKMKLVEAILGQRIKGENEASVTYDTRSEIKDIFSALRQDAASKKKKLPKND